MADYVERAINSLLNQSFDNFEIIAIDDGSSDETWRILQKMSNLDVRLRIHQQANRGLYLTRLVGCELSRAEWISFMDADDEILPDHLQTLWSGVGVNVGVVVGGITSITGDGKETNILPNFSFPDGYLAAKEILLEGHHTGLYPCWNKLYRKILLSTPILIRERINYGEDQIFNLRVFKYAKNWRVEGLPYATYRYISREGSILRSISETHIEEFFELWFERGAVAEMFCGIEGLFQRRYYNRRMIAVLDFFGYIYRSKNFNLANYFLSSLNAAQWSMPFPWRDPVLMLRWLKWRLRVLRCRLCL